MRDAQELLQIKGDKKMYQLNAVYDYEPYLVFKREKMLQWTLMGQLMTLKLGLQSKNKNSEVIMYCGYVREYSSQEICTDKQRIKRETYVCNLSSVVQKISMWKERANKNASVEYIKKM